MLVNKILKSMLSVSLLASVVACEEVATVSILSETEDFVQATEVNNKVDILWIVDNSGSMGDSQAAVMNNFEAFINDLASKNYDYQIAVIGTDAYLGGTRGKFSATSGVALITPNTPDLKEAFLMNINLGIRGSGHERGMQSLELALTGTLNEGHDFPRKNAFFSVIVVSDENDSSRPVDNSSYSYPGANHYLGILDELKLEDALAGKQTYSVNAIVRLPSNASCTSGSNGTRYIEMVEKTGGIVADICGDFSTSLSEITTSIVELSTQFYLKREPIIDSIKVIVNGVEVPMDAVNGWTYDAASMSIIFHGSAVPSQGMSIAIDFDPVKLKN